MVAKRRPSSSQRHAVLVSLCAFLATAACTHSDAFSSTARRQGPPPAGAPQRLTFNVDQDYWPAWSQDGNSILYAYVDLSSLAHRCLGILPSAGGTQLWHLCDNRERRADSISSYTAFALDTSGRLLYAEATAPTAPPNLLPSSMTLWLADTAAPFDRTRLLAISTLEPLNWLSDLRWTGTSTFTVLEQAAVVNNEPLGCAAGEDTLFYGGGQVMSGVISGGTAALTPIAGTDSATDYALADGGSTVVFTKVHSLQLFAVPATGGTAAAVATIPVGTELLGVSCRGDTCVVAADQVTLAPDACANALSNVSQLVTVLLSTGETAVAATDAGGIAVSPQLSPATGDAVFQQGGSFGHLETTRQPSNGDLYLLRSLVP